MLTLIALSLISFALLKLLLPRRAVPRTAAVLVLGDIGRSPRMMYHALSLARAGFATSVVGYAGSAPLPTLLAHPRVRIVHLPEPWRFGGWPFILSAPVKVLQQAMALVYTLLFGIEPPEFLFVQNPPSIPTLLITPLVAFFCGTKVILDWHNTAHSILALKLGVDSPIVRVAATWERVLGRNAHAHLFVTRAMRDKLVGDWGLRGIKAVLHDRPPAHFRRATVDETHDLFTDLLPSLPSDFLPTSSPPDSTPLTTAAASLSPTPTATLTRSLRTDRPALVVSSTSWTADEDFSILLSALARYELAARKPGADLPRVLCAVTGRGPMRDAYMARVGRMQDGRCEEGNEEAEGVEGCWEWVRCVSLWLKAEDYPVLLGSADVGVSLHASSSRLDLPMKVVDMFGCGLPVCALDFPSLPELVQHDHNGLTFRTAPELSTHLQTLLRGFPVPSPTLSALRRRLPPADWGTWDDNWDEVVRPIVSPGA